MERLWLDETCCCPSIWMHTDRSACGSFYDTSDKHDKNNAYCSGTMYSVQKMLKLWKPVTNFKLIARKQREIPQNDYYGNNMLVTDVYFQYQKVSYVAIANIVAKTCFSTKWHREIEKIYCFVFPFYKEEDGWWHDVQCDINDRDDFTYRSNPQIQRSDVVDLTEEFQEWQQNFWSRNATPQHEFDYIVFLLLLNKNNTLQSGK